MSASITVYMCPLEPPVMEFESKEDQYSKSGDWNVIYLQKVGEEFVDRFLLRMLKTSANYINAVWGFPDNLISWERAGTEVGTFGGSTSSLSDAIDIEVKNLGDKYLIRPYWVAVTINAQNPGEPIPYNTFVTIYRTVDSDDKIPESGIKEDYWKVTFVDSFFTEQTQFPVRPGEYISVQFSCLVNGKSIRSLFSVKLYDTPLFTGGFVKSRTEMDEYYLYDVQIGNSTVYGIYPTDFTEYAIGDWVYLLKDANLTYEEELRGRQEYSGSKGSVETAESLNNTINGIRTDNGDLRNLLSNPKLDRAAQANAEDLAKNGFDTPHVGTDGSSILDRTTEQGYVGIVGENAAFVTTTDDSDYDLAFAIDSWMHSPGHRANILNPIWYETGIACTQTTDQAVILKIYQSLINAGRMTSSEMPDPLPESLSIYVQVFGANPLVDGQINGKYRVIPFDFGGFPSTILAMPGTPFERIEWDSRMFFHKVFDTIRYNGKISNIDLDLDTASIEVNDTTYDNIPIFFHCDTEGPTVEGGSSAFDEGDTAVVVVPEGNDWDNAYIIANSDEMKSCDPEYLVLIFTAGDPMLPGTVNTVMVWDVKKNRAAEKIPLNSGGFATFPCDLKSISTWYYQTSEDVTDTQWDSANKVQSIDFYMGDTGTVHSYVSACGITFTNTGHSDDGLNGYYQQYEVTEFTPKYPGLAQCFYAFFNHYGDFTGVEEDHEKSFSYEVTDKIVAPNGNQITLTPTILSNATTEVDGRYIDHRALNEYYCICESTKKSFFFMQFEDCQTRNIKPSLGDWELQVQGHCMVAYSGSGFEDFNPLQLGGDYMASGLADFIKDGIELMYANGITRGTDYASLLYNEDVFIHQFRQKSKS